MSKNRYASDVSFREVRKEQSKLRYAGNRTKIDEKKKEWRDRNLDKIREYTRKSYQKNIERKHQYFKLYEQTNYIKKKAHRAVKYAKMVGKLIPQPCIECGNIKVHAHHFDYSRPLDVIWLCSIHHSEYEKTGKKGPSLEHSTR